MMRLFASRENSEREVAAAIVAVAEGLSDYLTMLGIDPDEVPEHGGPTTAQTLASVAIKSLGAYIMEHSDSPFGMPDNKEN
jgi:hypothetical protein